MCLVWVSVEEARWSNSHKGALLFHEISIHTIVGALGVQSKQAGPTNTCCLGPERLSDHLPAPQLGAQPLLSRAIIEGHYVRGRLKVNQVY